MPQETEKPSFLKNAWNYVKKNPVLISFSIGAGALAFGGLALATGGIAPLAIGVGVAAAVAYGATVSSLKYIPKASARSDGAEQTRAKKQAGMFQATRSILRDQAPAQATPQDRSSSGEQETRNPVVSAISQSEAKASAHSEGGELTEAQIQAEKIKIARSMQEIINPSASPQNQGNVGKNPLEQAETRAPARVQAQAPARAPAKPRAEQSRVRNVLPQARANSGRSM